MCAANQLGKGALYYYIGSKERLLVAIHDRVMDEVMLGADRVKKRGGTPSEQLTMLGDELLDVIARYPDHVWVFLHDFPALTGDNATQFRARRHEYEGRVEEVLETGVKAGEFRQLDSKLTARAWLGMHNYTYLWLKTHGSLSAAHVAASFADIFIRGISNASSTAAPRLGAVEVTRFAMFSPDDLIEMLRRMMLIRGFEERVATLYRDGEVPGFVHLSIGQEASAVGACWPLRATDVITSTHRGHGHCLAKGLSPLGMFAELMGRDSGTNRGRGGSMHIADPTIGIFGANGIVGAGLPIAVGAAAAAQLRADGGVAVAFFGDGAVAQGAFHEAVNLAAVWRLPVIFWCENNGYAEFSPSASQHAAPLERRAAGYGIHFVAVDGNDVAASAATMALVADAVREGRGPAIVEATTYRWHGHYEGDPQRYRPDSEVDAWKDRDPLLVQTRRLASMGFDPESLTDLEISVAELLDDAVAAARAGLAPEVSTLANFVVRPRPAAPEPPPPPADAPTFPHDGRDPRRAGNRIGQ